MNRELLTWFNGRLVPDSEVRIHHTDSGFSFGHNVTDSARTFGYRPFKLKEHIRRFYRSMSVARINPGMPPERMEEIALEVLEANLLNLDPDGDVWVTQTATGGPMRSTIGRFEFDRPGLLIATLPLGFADYAHLYEKGVHAVTPSTRHIPPQSLDAKLKHRNRIFFTLAEFEVKEVDPEGFSLLLDIDGNVSENKGANFFIYRDGCLRTPTTRNVLEGVSRATVLELAHEEGIPSVEEDIQPYHVATAEEAFFCSTSYCMLPVARYNGSRLGAGRPGPVYRRLLDAWSRWVGMDIQGQALRAAGTSERRLASR